MNRKLIAGLGCRMNGSRLYGKPLQNLDIEHAYSILDNIIAMLKEMECIADIVLGIAHGNDNVMLIDYAKKNNLNYILGAEDDALSRLIMCGEAVNATDVFRVTTECPFIHYEMINQAWQHHLNHKNDVTVTDGLPEGTHFEIYTLDSLKTSHQLGNQTHRKEFCSLYIREHWDDFKIEVLLPRNELRRTDLRLTVDYPEDLTLCRKVYHALKHQAPLIKLDSIIDFLDAHPHIQAIVSDYVDPEYLWYEETA